MTVTVRQRPFGISLLSILVIIAGALDVLAGILSVSIRGDDELLVEVKGSQGEITAFGSGLIILGVIAIVVGFMLWRGSAFARILIGIIALVRLVGTIWVFASLTGRTGTRASSSLVLYALVAGYLLFGTTARDYTGVNLILSARWRWSGHPCGVRNRSTSAELISRWRSRKARSSSRFRRSQPVTSSLHLLVLQERQAGTMLSSV